MYIYTAESLCHFLKRTSYSLSDSSELTYPPSQWKKETSEQLLIVFVGTYLIIIAINLATFHPIDCNCANKIQSSALFRCRKSPCGISLATRLRSLRILRWHDDHKWPWEFSGFSNGVSTIALQKRTDLANEPILMLDVFFKYPTELLKALMLHNADFPDQMITMSIF